MVRNNLMRRTQPTGRSGQRGDTQRGSVVFLGDSDELLAVHDWAVQRGFAAVDIPHPELVCAVVDEDILDGMCTPLKADIVQRVRDSGLPCLPPSHARSWLAEPGGRPRLSVLPHAGQRA